MSSISRLPDLLAPPDHTRSAVAAAVDDASWLQRNADVRRSDAASGDLVLQRSFLHLFPPRLLATHERRVQLEKLQYRSHHSHALPAPLDFGAYWPWPVDFPTERLRPPQCRDPG